jgi:hypothetical protein
MSDFHTPRPGPLHPNGSLWLIAITSIGRVMFGWMSARTSHITLASKT